MQFYLSLRNILDIILSPTVQCGETKFLACLISEYLEMRHILFPEITAKNKHHHLIHYPRLIEEVGPMSSYSCMRFESKHQRYKRLMHIGGNFKNVPKTVSTSHQHVAFRMLRKDSSFSNVKVGRGTVVDPRS